MNWKPSLPPMPASDSTTAISYEGRPADSGRNPLTGTYGMIVRLYDVASSGVRL